MIFKSPYADVDIPNVSLQHYILSRMVNYGDKPALIDGPSGRTLTYAQLVQMINGLANGLQARGFGKGDVFAVLSPNIPEYPVLFHGVGLAGGITTTMNPLYAVEEIVHQLEDSSARYLITVPPFVENALAAAEQVNSVEEVFVFGEAEGATPVTALFGQSAPEPVEIDPAEDLVVMPYSSGTTGLPKGVMLTHRNMVANIVQLEGIEPVTDQDVIIAVLPMFHIYGMELIINVSLANGATIVTMPRFDMAQFLQLVQDHKVTKAHLVPPILLGLAKHPVVDQFDTTSVRVIVSGAAPLDAALGQAVAERLGCIVKQGYGLTETSPVLMVNPDDKPRDGTVGPAVRGTEFMIVDVDSGEPLGPGQRGELWARGPQ
ncbi:MAG: 4-coumarate--CoA ligase family protein, partial [Chloroflexi bacterium]|nr:4-coumarate--CoA ligase family protein [Chloroflexota bacterium]